MANVFGILSALLLAVAAFVAHKNSEALKKEIELTGREDQAFQENQAMDAKLKDEIDALVSETEKLTAEGEELTGKLNEQKEGNSKVELAITEKETEAKGKEDKVNEAKKSLADLGDIPDLVREMKSTQKSVADLTNEIGVLEAKLSQLEQSKKALGSTLTTLKDTNRMRRQKKAPADLSTRVRSVYNTWGFVTIAAGDNDNVMTGSTLQVLRGGEPIAQLKVTSVEANTAAADIVKDSIAEGESVSPGDTVVPVASGEAASAPAPSTPAPAASSDDEPAAEEEVQEEEAADEPADEPMEEAAEADPFS
ncbi:MAG: hypothetical protein ACQKBY_12220 [Verrucomicrobiales bacterium]